MAKAKKTKKVEEVKNEELLQPQLGELTIPQKKLEDAEWCFQFDGDEPQVFAWTDDSVMNKNEDPKVIFTITNMEDSYISFTHGQTGKSFKIFVRELTDEGKKLRDNQRLQLIAQKNLEENGSENKEA